MRNRTQARARRGLTDRLDGGVDHHLASQQGSAATGAPRVVRHSLVNGVPSGAWAQLVPADAHGRALGGHKQQPIYLVRRIHRIGRNKTNDTVLDDAHISGCHCIIYQETIEAQGRSVTVPYIENVGVREFIVDGERLTARKRTSLEGHELIVFPTASASASSSSSSSSIVDSVLRYQFRLLCDRRIIDGSAFQQLYDIEAALGKGQFATVRRVCERATNERYAVKILNKAEMRKNERLFDTLSSETRILRVIDHPSITQVADVYDTEERLFIIMEYMRDGELFDLITQRQKLTEVETKIIFRQLLNAVKYLHDEHGIVHRDLKPENILMADKARLRVKISDFGLAKLLDEAEFMNTLCGTPTYVAPEILEKRATRFYTKAVDMWSLGVILYICLSGVPPFHTSHAPPDLRTQIKQALYDFPEQHWAHVSANAKDLIRRLIELDPKRRYTAEQALNHPFLQDVSPMTMRAVENGQLLPPPTPTHHTRDKSIPRLRRVSEEAAQQKPQTQQSSAPANLPPISSPSLPTSAAAPTLSPVAAPSGAAETIASPPAENTCSQQLFLTAGFQNGEDQTIYRTAYSHCSQAPSGLL